MKAKTTKQMPPMKVGRSSHGSCILNNKLYVFGGIDKYQGKTLASMEVLDLNDPREWVI